MYIEISEYVLVVGRFGGGFKDDMMFKFILKVEFLREEECVFYVWG